MSNPGFLATRGARGGMLVGTCAVLLLASAAQGASSGREARSPGATATRSSSSPSSPSAASGQSVARGQSAARSGSTATAPSASGGREAVPTRPGATAGSRHTRSGTAPGRGVPARFFPYPYYHSSWYYQPWAWGFGGWGGHWGPVVAPAAVVYRDRAAYAQLGAIDFAISPRRAEIYVDGELVGRAADFSGWRDYLWLPRGSYDVVVYHEGYRTLARQVSIYPGQVIRWRDRMERGEAVRPEDLADRSTARREARLQRDRERREAVERLEPSGRGDAWRERTGTAPYPSRTAPGVVEPPSAAAPEAIEEVEIRAGRDDAEESFGTLRLSVTPQDASVYLDGRFLGTGSELALTGGGLYVEPGQRRLQVVRPGYRQEDVSFQARAGEEQEVRIDLAPY
jgi:hypothetical protein